MPHSQNAKPVSWWLSREADGWHWFISGDGWLKRSAPPFPLAYAAQADALAFFRAL